MLKKKLLLVFLSGFIFLLLIIPSASPQRRVSINEIAWGGTKANPYDEWIELRNNTEKDILLDGWKLLSESGKICILLSGIIPAKGFFLLERSSPSGASLPRTAACTRPAARRVVFSVTSFRRVICSLCAIG